MFLSTLPARGATSKSSSFWAGILFLSTLPARGATPAPLSMIDAVNFYPRSPRGERRILSGQKTHSFLFLSTLPARGATCV